MPLSILNKLPESARKLWESTYKSAREKYGEDKAARIAWGAVKKRFKRVEDRWVARSEDFLPFTSVKYVFAPEETVIARGKDGFTLIKQPLASTKSIGGISLSKVALQHLAKQINSEGVRGMIDDSHFSHLFLKQNINDDDFDDYEEKVRSLDTGIDAINAVVEGDKLIATIRVRNDVLDKVNSFKGASVEARIPKESIRAGITDQARLSSFVFTSSPADDTAVRN